ncbi:hypothetical protein GOP47_0025245 [Adiantum capillus-veneris]|uniref:NAD-dependent epimerase/dehydratase domain-containing protein n=1 Tax=Adiantum capillus-veneris TaxID=13818 RepID=A0A9D4U042_ADICA|nr:hypothetical protein GOP47_0025245 [Adiantum capillus-veneris]
MKGTIKHYHVSPFPISTPGRDVSGTCSHEEKRMALQEAGFCTFLFDSDESEQLTEEGLLALQNATHMIATIPPVADFDKDPVLSVYREQVSQISRHLNLHWIGYLSSTGVYGDYQGQWVDENSQTKPVDKRGVARLEAEREWLQVGVESGACVQVFRLGGIYGPGRSAINTLLRPDRKSSKQRKRESRQYTSRIHVSDICQVVMASIQSPCPGQIYNVVDDDPASRSEVFSYAKSILCERWPQMKHLVEPTNLEGSSNVEEVHKLRRSPEKRVQNTRLKDDLQGETAMKGSNMLESVRLLGTAAEVELLKTMMFQRMA